MAVFWGVAPRSLVVTDRRLKGLHQGDGASNLISVLSSVGQYLLDYTVLFVLLAVTPEISPILFCVSLNIYHIEARFKYNCIS
jgi:hypothetical protein